MNFNFDIDDDIFPSAPRLVRPFALRDFIAGNGAEFEIEGANYQDEDEEQFFNNNRSHAKENEDFINLNALDVETDEFNKIVTFSELRKCMSPITSNGKVMKLIKKPGTGSIVKENSVVYVHYSAYANLDEMPFDNSFIKERRPERLQLGIGRIVFGLELGLKTMKKGEVSQILVDPEYAYGARGCPPRIPPEATILFEVELLNFVDVASSEDPENFGGDRRSFSYALKEAKRKLEVGNDLFRNQKVTAAIKEYQQAVNLLYNCSLRDDEEETEQKKQLLRLFTNLSVGYLKQNRPKNVCGVAKDAIYCNKEGAMKNSKLLYNWGCALVLLTEYKRAAEILRAALKVDPNNRTIIDEISKLEKKKSHNYELEKNMSRMALGFKEVNPKAVPTLSNANDDVHEELKEQVKRKIEDAKRGITVKINLMPEAIDRVEELCKSIITEADSLMVEKINGALLISKVNSE